MPRVDGLMNSHLSVYSGTIVFHCEIHSYSSLHVYHQTIRHIFQQRSSSACLPPNYMTYLIRYVFVACVITMTDRGRLKYRFFRKKKFGNYDEKSDFYGSENETRKFRLRTGSPEISRKNGSLPAKTGGLAALHMHIIMEMGLNSERGVCQ